MPQQGDTAAAGGLRPMRFGAPEYAGPATATPSLPLNKNPFDQWASINWSTRIKQNPRDALQYRSLNNTKSAPTGAAAGRYIPAHQPLKGGVASTGALLAGQPKSYWSAKLHQLIASVPVEIYLLDTSQLHVTHESSDHNIIVLDTSAKTPKIVLYNIAGEMTLSSDNSDISNDDTARRNYYAMRKCLVQLYLSSKYYKQPTANAADAHQFLKLIGTKPTTVNQRTTSHYREMVASMLTMAEVCSSTRLNPYDPSRVPAERNKQTKGAAWAYFIRFVRPQQEPMATGIFIQQYYGSPAFSNHNIEANSRYIQRTMREYEWVKPVIVAIPKTSLVRDVPTKMTDAEYESIFAYPRYLAFELPANEFQWENTQVLGAGANGQAILTRWRPSMREESQMMAHERRLWRHRAQPDDTHVDVQIVVKQSTVSRMQMYPLRMEYVIATRLHHMQPFVSNGVTFDDSFITPVFGFVVMMENYGLVMKRMVGTLHQRLKNNAQWMMAYERTNNLNMRQYLLAPEYALDMMMQVAHALAFLHHHKIIHGDVKTDNVLMDDKGTCNLGDLGALAFMGKPHTNLGTMAYSPEGENKSHVTTVRLDGARDIYAFGYQIMEDFLNRVNWPTGVKSSLIQLRQVCLKSSSRRANLLDNITAEQVFFRLRQLRDSVVAARQAMAVTANGK